MHTVIIDECTGCDLCVAPCPVDCIDMLPLHVATVVPIVGGLAATHAQRAERTAKRNRARQRFEARNARLQREERQRQAERLARKQPVTEPRPTTPDPVQAALARIGAQKAPDAEAALKQARVNVAMSRAQLNKSLKAFGHPPIAEQAAQLELMQRELDNAEQVLVQLQVGETQAVAGQPATPAPIDKADKAALNRAKIQLAMSRAALKKAQAAEADAQGIAALSDKVRQAEQALKALETTQV
jgi:electron transport complex protein RnfB